MEYLSLFCFDFSVASIYYNVRIDQYNKEIEVKLREFL